MTLTYTVSKSSINYLRKKDQDLVGQRSASMSEVALGFSRVESIDIRDGC